MGTQYLTQSRIQQVSSRVISCTGSTLLQIYTSHEVGLRMLWQFVGNVYGHTVLMLGIHNVDGLELAAYHTTFAYLTTHFAIEWGVVKYYLIECLFLLSYLAIAKDVTFVFAIVVTYKLSFSLTKCYPVACLYSSSITGTGFLLLHLFTKLLLIYRQTVLTANQFGKVEWETVGVEQSECLYTIQFSLALSFHLIHCLAQQVDTIVQCT